MTITAKIIADSVSPQGVRLTTLQLRYPKFIHGEFMTHRVFSRNASSSRAIPVERLIRDVLDDPAMPLHWGKNQPGMQANEECNERVLRCPPKVATEWWTDRYATWLDARDYAVHLARAYSNAGYHKQIVNRLLEPFCHINVVVTATEWSNFFALRCHEGAQPEMRMLAEAIRDAMAANEPTQVPIGVWHLPYVTLVDRDLVKIEDRIKLSVARCARVSYLTQEGRVPTVAEDLALYDRLMGAVPLHASPAEHQATPDIYDLVLIPAWKIEQGPQYRNPDLHGNFWGWVQYRKTLPGESQ